MIPTLQFALRHAPANIGEGPHAGHANDLTTNRQHRNYL